MGWYLVTSLFLPVSHIVARTEVAEVVVRRSEIFIFVEARNGSRSDKHVIIVLESHLIMRILIVIELFLTKGRVLLERVVCVV